MSISPAFSAWSVAVDVPVPIAMSPDAPFVVMPELNVIEPLIPLLPAFGVWIKITPEDVEVLFPDNIDNVPPVLCCAYPPSISICPPVLPTLA
jgi:hypothetical protein